MATAIAMDLDQCEAAKGGKTAASLSINKSSASKISKSSSLRRPIVQQAKPMPTSKVYNTDPMGFRTLVQELTGYAPSSTSAGGGASSSSNTSAASNNNNNLNSNSGMQPTFSQPQQQQQQQQVLPDSASNQQQHMSMMMMNVNPPRPSLSLVGAGGSSHMVMSETTTTGLSSPSATTTSVSSPQSSARPVNTRLQRMAPPPLRPTFSFNFAQKLQQQQHQIQQQQPGQQQEQQQQQGQAPSLSDSMNLDKENNNNMSSPGAHPLSPMSKRVSPLPLLSFSPMPVLSPTDNAWASFESPNTAAMKQLAQSILEGKNHTNNGGSSGMMMGVAGLSRFPWSPTFQACLGLPSPGLPVPELFPDVKMIDSPDTNTNTSINKNSNESSTNTNDSNKNNNTSTNSNMFGNDFSFPEIRNS